jgi:hypothetical protein
MGIRAETVRTRPSDCESTAVSAAASREAGRRVRFCGKVRVIGYATRLPPAKIKIQMPLFIGSAAERSDTREQFTPKRLVQGVTYVSGERVRMAVRGPR